MLLGAISLSRLPVDLMPEFEQPTLTVRTSYTGVGPLEIEELITRPIEQAVSAVAGLTRVDSTSSRRQQPGPAELRRGAPNLDEAADEVRTPRSIACAAACRRTPTRRRSSSSTRTRCRSCRSASRATTTRSRCASSPRTSSSPRLERVAGVAAVTVNGGLRRQIHVDLSKEKITALNLSVNQVVQALTSENQNTAARRDLPGRLDVPGAQPGAVPEHRRHPQPRRA